MAFFARYPGQCHLCELAIDIGVGVVYRADQLVHVACDDKAWRSANSRPTRSYKTSTHRLGRSPGSTDRGRRR